MFFFLVLRHFCHNNQGKVEKKWRKINRKTKKKFFRKIKILKNFIAEIF